MSLDFITASKIKEAESKWEQTSKRLALMEEQLIRETRPEERFRMEHEINEMKEDRQKIELELAELQKGASPAASQSTPEQESSS
ncbi:MAG: hypothetical protein D3908_10485, partial [Candidatus Electrothrix sp. AUS4]|nr:hypothetical protein [Candidatus Electrothrix sp. AUS4]